MSVESASRRDALLTVGLFVFALPDPDEVFALATDETTSSTPIEPVCTMFLVSSSVCASIKVNDDTRRHRDLRSFASYYSLLS